MTLGDQLAEDAGTSKDTAEYTGRALVSGVMLPFAMVWWVAEGFLGEAWARLPGRNRIAKKALKFGYQTLYKHNDCHFIVNATYGDGTTVPRLGRYDSETERVETTNGEAWAAPNGPEKTFMWDVPIVQGVAEHHQMTGPLKATITDCVDLSADRFQTVKRTAEGHVPVTYDDPIQPGADEVLPTQAVADGGVTQADVNAVGRAVNALAPDEEADTEPATITDVAAHLRSHFNQVIQNGSDAIRLKPSSTFDDIFLDTEPPEDNDGWIVSLSKAKELHWSVGSNEEMENQEWRGRQAELDRQSGGSFTIMHLLMAVGVTAALIIGPMWLFGGGGGDSLSNANPLGSIVFGMWGWL